MAKVAQNVRWQPWGVIVGVRASTDPTFAIELQRQSSGSTWRTIQQRRPAGSAALEQFRDVLPSSTFDYSYRARSVRDGYTASTWTNTVSAAPLQLPTGQVIPPKVKATVARSSAQTVTWTPSSLSGQTYLDWDTTVENSAAMVSSSRYLTIPYTDYYDVTLHLSYENFRKSTVAGVTGFYPTLYFGGGGPGRVVKLTALTTANSAGSVTFSEQFNLSAGANTYFQVLVGGSTTRGGTITFTTESRWSVSRVSAYA